MKKINPHLFLIFPHVQWKVKRDTNLLSIIHKKNQK